MQIKNVSNSYNKPTFKAGKVRVFSDFDRTFLPSSQKDFATLNNTQFINELIQNFKSFKEFLNKTREGLKFTITTGRTFGEFLTMAEIAKERHFNMPLPDTLIVKNGSDEHIKIGTDEEFYNGGKFPFKYEVTNEQKELRIKEISGWDGSIVKKIIEDVLTPYNFRIIIADSEHSATDYGSKSMFSQGKIPYEVGKIFDENNKADWSVGIRKDGNLKVFITLPADMNDVEDRQIIFNNIKKEIQKRFNSENIKNTNGDDTALLHGRPCLSYVPMISNNTLNKNLTKLYDTQVALIEAQKNNDLVIVAGDSSNDFEMLNPAYYLDELLIEKMNKKHGKKFTNAIHTPEKFIKLMDEDLELAEAFIKMPFRGIIVRQPNGENRLDVLEPFTKGKYQKIIVVNEGNLQNGIKKSIEVYCEQNSSYKEKLSNDLKQQINSDIKDNNNKDEKPNKNKTTNSSVWKYAVGILTFLGIGSGIYLFNKNNKKNSL